MYTFPSPPSSTAFRIDWKIWIFSQNKNEFFLICLQYKTMKSFFTDKNFSVKKSTKENTD